MLDWWKRLSRLGKLAGVIAAISGAIVSVAAAWPIVEPLWYVSRGELRQIMDRQATAQDRQSIIILKGQLNDAMRDPGASNSPIVKERIKDIEKDLREAVERVTKAMTGRGQ